MPVGLIAPLPPQVGGVPSMAAWLLDNQDRIGCSYETFDLWRPATGGSGGRITFRTLGFQGRNALWLIWWLRGRPRVVHYCVAANPTGLARDLAFLGVLRVSRRTVIAHVHGGSQLAHARHSAAYRLALRLLRRLSASVVVVAPRIAAQFQRQGIPVRVIVNPVCVEPQARPAHREGTSLRALFVGSWGRDKGLPELLAAIARSRVQRADITLRVAGRPKFRRDAHLIRRQVAALGLKDAVSFAGVLTAPSLAAEYAAADVLCLPSRDEGLPMVVIEAMAHGLPVVATRIGGVADVVNDGVTGVCFEVGDTEALERALIRLARDPEQRQRMGLAGRERIGKLVNADHIAAAWRSTYLAAGGAGP